MFILAVAFTSVLGLPQRGFSRERQPQYAVNQPPAGFDSGFNGPTLRRPAGNRGVLNPGIQRVNF